jgi:hypothetical protein
MDKLTSYKRLRAGVLAVLGNECAKCGFSDYRALQIDHVNSDGALERAEFGGPSQKFLKRVLLSFVRGEGRYQLLCANCNWIKRAELGETSNGVQRDQETDGYGNRKYLS